MDSSSASDSSRAARRSRSCSSRATGVPHRATPRLNPVLPPSRCRSAKATSSRRSRGRCRAGRKFIESAPGLAYVSRDSGGEPPSVTRATVNTDRRMPAATNRQLAVRLAVGRALGRTRDLDDVYSAALDTLAECLDVSRASVLLFDPDGVMRFKAWRNLSSEYRAAVQGHSPWTPDSVDAEPLLVPDVAREPSLATYLPVFARERIAAMAFIPLVSLGRVIGKFMLYYAEPHAFDDEEVQLVGVIAAAVAFAVERGKAQGGARRGDPASGFIPNASSIGPWEWEVSPEDPVVRPDGLPSGTLRQ